MIAVKKNTRAKCTDLCFTFKTIKTMKHLLCFAAAVALLFTACTSEESLDNIEPVTNAKTEQEVTITFSPYTMESMAKTRAAEPIGTLTDRLDVWIFEGDSATALTQTKAVAEQHQQKSDDGFGTLSVKLDRAKTYTLYAVAHWKQSPATINGGIVSFPSVPNVKVAQTFVYTTTFSPSETTTLSCVMQRCVGMFKVCMKDEVIPSDVKKFEISTNGTPKQWSFVENKGISPSDFYAVYWDKFFSGPDGLEFVIYIIGSDTEKPYDITVTAYGADGAVIKQRTFPQVSIRNNYMTVYSGTFFLDTPFTPTFTLESDWTETVTEY